MYLHFMFPLADFPLCFVYPPVPLRAVSTTTNITWFVNGLSLIANVEATH